MTEGGLLGQLRAYQVGDPLLLCTPGHHQGRYSAPELQDLLGNALSCDLTVLAGLDNLQAPQGVLAVAQAEAAQLWGADHTFFLVNGATSGLQALLLGTVPPKGKVLLPRNIHSAIVGALVLGGIEPIWLDPVWDPMLGIAHGVTPEQVQAALTANPGIQAVLLVYPTYYGSCGPLAPVVDLVHNYGIPVLIDSAHGSHLAFHSDVPPCAVATGCDGVVHATHKTAGSLTQSALLHLTGPLIDAARVQQALNLIQSTSPSYLLLASLAAMTHLLRTEGQPRWAQALAMADQMRQALDPLAGCTVLKAPPDHLLDPTRITLEVPVDGFALEEFLITQNIHPELSGPNHLVFLITPGTPPDAPERLIVALKTGLAQLPALPPNRCPAPPRPMIHSDLRAVFFGPRERLPLPQALGRVSAQTLSLYPPGIPLVLPGERLTTDLVEYIRKLGASRALITGWQPGETIEVVT